jgi:hypothetical protein
VQRAACACTRDALPSTPQPERSAAAAALALPRRAALASLARRVLCRSARLHGGAS